MQNKLFIIILFVAFVGCSSEKVTESNNSINIFDMKNNLPVIINNQKQSARLSVVENINNIPDAKSYNLKNAFIKFPLKKNWELNTNQIIDDKNPYLPDPIYFSPNLFLLNNHGILFKIETKNGKIVWKKSIFNNLEDTIIGTPAISAKLSNDGEVTIYAHNGYNQIIAMYS